MAKQQNNGQEQDVNQLRKVRRDKLAELQQNGNLFLCRLSLLIYDSPRNAFIIEKSDFPFSIIHRKLYKISCKIKSLRPEKDESF